MKRRHLTVAARRCYRSSAGRGRVPIAGLGNYFVYPSSMYAVAASTSQGLVRPGRRLLEIIMGTAQTSPAGPDLTQGVPVDRLSDGGMLAGHVGEGEEVVLLVQRGDDFFAVGATCTHYGGPLADGLVVGDTVRCPWHHAG